MVLSLATLPNEAHPVIWRSLVAVCVIANLIWYLAKYILKTHSFAVSLIWHARDVPNLYRLARQGADPTKRFGYFSLFVAQWLVD
jgi:hypothetical protein